MGTRHLIAVAIDGEYKVAQYGQWDGYFEGQGVDVLNFLKNVDYNEFKNQVRNLSFLTKEDMVAINENDNWVRDFPWLSRDAGSDILNYVVNNNGNIKLKNSIGFAGDSLFCEYAYVIDLDKDIFEIYVGFNEEPTPADSRFPSGADWLEKTDGYHPVKLIYTINLADMNMPMSEMSEMTDEKFISELNTAAGYNEDE